MSGITRDATDKLKPLKNLSIMKTLRDLQRRAKYASQRRNLPFFNSENGKDFEVPTIRKINRYAF